ncbi:small subunit ribosomal protein S20 [Clostridium collagenovorans DSM 3089]|uniref:Small ribosomal subunit protein bS20 n=1 Tax=Clostridium collagenovorans DSM 3089 TaxID=1121306 RepID=A0A1M5XR37_9CLOT|nr:30S ribosomal protein S20 [Clostridium collagenovorans]SHI02132.1 small subunit ribosomal protein S20 [Clostridium collagenovorans DSM 3089]
MANSRSAKKRIKVNATKALANKMVKSALKTSIKNFEVSVVAGNKEEATAKLTLAVKAIDMACAKNILHKNKASRDKSRLAAKLNAMA